jgi:hypothetical protein
MYTADHADIDPRNPANFSEVKPTGFTILSNQFSDEDFELVGEKTILYFEIEAEACQQAFAIARLIAKPVTITPHTEDGSGWFDDIVVKPSVKLA